MNWIWTGFHFFGLIWNCHDAVSFAGYYLTGWQLPWRGIQHFLMSILNVSLGYKKLVLSGNDYDDEKYVLFSGIPRLFYNQQQSWCNTNKLIIGHRNLKKTVIVDNFSLCSKAQIRPYFYTAPIFILCAVQKLNKQILLSCETANKGVNICITLIVVWVIMLLPHRTLLPQTSSYYEVNCESRE